MRKVLLVLVLVAAVAGAAVSARRLFGRGGPDLPTVRVARGNLDLSVHTTGELRAARSAMVVAPSVGTTLQIVRLAASGSSVQAGAVVVEFDPSEQEFGLEQSRSELDEAEQELVRSRAEAEVQAAQDQVALLKARFAVRRAELDLRARDMIGAIEARKNELTLDEARRRLMQLEEDLQSKGTTSRAGLAVLEAKRDKARLAMASARQNIDNMTVKAPIDGVVVVRQNMDASGGMYYSGMTLPDYRAGDMVGSGRLVAEIMDTSGLEIQAQVNEADRANVNQGQHADVRVDGLPGGPFPATIRNVSSAAVRGYYRNEGRRKFDTILALAAPDERLRCGLSARVTIAGQQLKGVLYVPRQALFEKEGKPLVHIRAGRGFEPRAVKVRFRSESRAVIEGVGEGVEVALVDPENRGTRPGQAGSTTAPTPGGAR